MRIFVFNRQNIWKDELTDGFTRLGHEIKSGYPTNEAEFDALIESFRPNCMITMGATTMYEEFLLDYLKNSRKDRTYIYIHWDTEGYTHRGYTKHMCERAEPNVLWTTGLKVKEMMEEKGLPTYIMPYGLNEKIHYPINARYFREETYSMIASNYTLPPSDYRMTAYTILVDPLLEHNIPVEVRGYGWDKDKERIAKGLKVFPYCPYPETNKIYNEAFMNLVVHNAVDGIKKRTYEILGAGGFILSCDTAEIRKQFVNGRELVISSSPKETIEIVQYYKTHLDEYWKIRENAAKRAHEFSYSERLREVLEDMKSDGRIKLPE